jgi:hypothetical protein
LLLESEESRVKEDILSFASELKYIRDESL